MIGKKDFIQLTRNLLNVKKLIQKLFKQILLLKFNFFQAIGDRIILIVRFQNVKKIKNLVWVDGFLVMHHVWIVL